MSAPSRALAALTLAAALLVPTQGAFALGAEDPAPAQPAATADRAPSPPVVNAAEGASPLPDIATRSWVLADMDSGAVLAMQDPDVLMRPASTLKLLTALTVAPRLAPEQPYRAVKADETAEGSRVVLYEGLKYTVADLMHAALLPSANDAAEALARANGGIDVTVAQMNAEAARLGATSTTAKNPSGLDADGQFTTARDLAAIGRAALANPEIAGYLKLRTVEFPGKDAPSGRVVYPIYNHNRMVLDNFEGVIGGKSGFTTLARRTMVAAAERDGRRLIVSLLNIGGNTYRTPEVLLDWAFANLDKLSPVDSLPQPTAPAPVFERTIMELPTAGATPVNRDRIVQVADDAPTAPARQWSMQLPGMPTPGMPSPLTILTLLTAVLVVLRARVYWITHRSRSAWTHLDDRAATRARSTGRRGPVDRRIPSDRATRRSDESLIGAGK